MPTAVKFRDYKHRYCLLVDFGLGCIADLTIQVTQFFIVAAPFHRAYRKKKKRKKKRKKKKEEEAEEEEEEAEEEEEEEDEEEFLLCPSFPGPLCSTIMNLVRLSVHTAIKGSGASTIFRLQMRL